MGVLMPTNSVERFNTETILLVIPDFFYFFLLLVRAYPLSTIIIDSVSLTRPDYYFNHVCCYLMGVLMPTNAVERFHTETILVVIPYIFFVVTCGYGTRSHLF